MLAAEDVQRQVAVAVVVAVKEAAQLDGRGSDRRWRRGRARSPPAAAGAAARKASTKKAAMSLMPGDDLLVAALRVGPRGRQFQAVQRALAGQRLAAIARSATLLAGRIALADQRRQERIVPQVVVVVEVFVAQGQGEHPLGDQFVDRVLDQLGIAVIVEAGGESPECRSWLRPPAAAARRHPK